MRPRTAVVPELLKRVGAKAFGFGELWYDRARGRKRVHMLHIGKTGGTALKSALRNASPAHTRLVLHKHSVSLAEIPVGELCFFVVRDPVTRFVSGFLSRQRQGRPRYDIPWNPAEEKAFATFATPNDLALALSSTDPARRSAAEAAMAGIRHVSDNYRHWLRSEAYLRQRRSDILFVGSQERLREDVRLLSGLLDAMIVLPTDAVAAHRNPANVHRDLDATSVENLKNWYSADYVFLRLLREWFPHLPDYEAA